MNDQVITCPHCQKSIPLSKTLFAQATKDAQQQARQELEQQLAQQKKELQLVMQQQLQSAITAKQAEIVAKTKQTQEVQTKQLDELKQELQRKAEQLAESEKQEVALRKKSRELEEKEQRLNLELERKIDEEREKISTHVKKQEAEAHGLRLQEKDKQLDLMRKQIEELRRKAQQGSMQIQGEVQENQLKELLGVAFPTDDISDVPTGIKGADLIQRINAKMGLESGTIIWESKNTKSFSEGWITKLKGDQGIVKADVAVLVSQVLPDGVNGFTLRNGVWLVSYEHAVPLALALRTNIIELKKITASFVGRDEKMTMLYQYLSGPQFKNRVENIVMAFVAMKSDLEAERRALTKIWSKREKEIEKVILSTSSMYGDLQGIIGGSLPTIEQLEFADGHAALDQLTAQVE